MLNKRQHDFQGRRLVMNGISNFCSSNWNPLWLQLPRIQCQRLDTEGDWIHGELKRIIFMNSEFYAGDSPLTVRHPIKYNNVQNKPNIRYNTPTAWPTKGLLHLEFVWPNPTAFNRCNSLLAICEFVILESRSQYSYIRIRGEPSMHELVTRDSPGQGSNGIFCGQTAW